MNEFVTSVLTSAAVSAGLTAAFIWLTKAWIGARMKSAIQHEYDVSLARLRLEIETAAGRQTEIILETRNVLHEGIAKVAAATHSMCWLTWLASESPSRISEKRVELYDAEMHELLPQIMSFHARLSTYSTNVSIRFGELLDHITDLDARIGSAAIRLLDGDSAAIELLKMQHVEAIALHKKLSELCSQTSMKTLFEKA